MPSEKRPAVAAAELRQERTISRARAAVENAIREADRLDSYRRVKVG